MILGKSQAANAQPKNSRHRRRPAEAAGSTPSGRVYTMAKESTQAANCRGTPGRRLAASLNDEVPVELSPVRRSVLTIPPHLLARHFAAIRLLGRWLGFAFNSLPSTLAPITHRPLAEQFDKEPQMSACS